MRLINADEIVKYVYESKGYSETVIEWLVPRAKTGEERRMTFEEFQEVCKYMKYGCDYMGSHEFYATCRRPGNVPEGHSWGICDIEHCPYVNKLKKDRKEE